MGAIHLDFLNGSFSLSLPTFTLCPYSDYIRLQQSSSGANYDFNYRLINLDTLDLILVDLALFASGGLETVEALAAMEFGLVSGNNFCTVV